MTQISKSYETMGHLFIDFDDGFHVDIALSREEAVRDLLNARKLAGVDGVKVFHSHKKVVVDRA